MIARIPDIDVPRKGATAAEKIFSFFLNPRVRFGPVEFIRSERQYWLDKFNYFIARREPLQFTLLGFPFKMAVPLKTDRALPDMGEVLALGRLNLIARAIRGVYEPGAVITVFTEGGLGRSAGIAPAVWRKYDRRLRELAGVLGFGEAIRIRKLSGMERLADFQDVFMRKRREFRAQLADKDKCFMEKYRAVFSPIFRLVNARKYALEELMDVYNEKLEDAAVSSAARRIRAALRAKTKKAIIYYFSYLAARDELDYLEKAVPHHLSLSVSPKPRRLGIIPIDAKVKILPYHGVSVYDALLGRWDIGYLVDIKRDFRHKYAPVSLNGDADPHPFYYEIFRKK